MIESNTITVVKIGGNVMDDPLKLQVFLKLFVAIDGQKILVHGGGKIATTIGNRLGIESKYVAGRRLTDKATLDLVTMVYGGLLNKQIVAALQALGCQAMGLSGADGNSILAKRREATEIDYGFVGDVSERGVNTAFLLSLIQSGIVPVIAPLTHDGKGSLLNSNADSITQAVATALSQVRATRIIFCFEKSGVLLDPNDETSVIQKINATNFQELKESGRITDGMIPKLSNAITAIEAGVSTVVIGQAEELPQLIDGSKGTQIT